MSAQRKLNDNLTSEEIKNDSDKAMAILGVPGRLTHRTRKIGREADCWFKQRWTSLARKVTGFGKNGLMTVEVKFDDELHNRHNSFHITAEVVTDESRRHRDIAAGGCLHDEIRRWFPELAPLIRWHHMNDDGPMHFPGNVLYLAGTKDCYGREAGEVATWDESITFDGNPIHHKVRTSFWKWLQEHRSGMGGEFDFEVIRIDQEDRGKPGKYQFAPKFTFGGYGNKWHECPFDTEKEAMEFLKALQTCNPQFVTTPASYSEGKERDLRGARACAAGLELSDAELCLPRNELEVLLMSRLPQLLVDFKTDIERIGFYMNPQDYAAAQRSQEV